MYENVQLTVGALIGALALGFGPDECDLPEGNRSVSWLRLTWLSAF